MRLLLFLLPSLLAAEQVLIPGGSFVMGRTKLTPDDQTTMRPRILLDDRPEHTVTLKPFRLDTHEVTHAEYAAFVQARKYRTPYHWKGGVMPPALAKVAVYNVSWDDAKAYCEFRGGRLPTEAEWERAARGGLDRQDYPWGDKFDAKQLRSGVESGPGAVGQHPPNAYGLYDMAGNLSEWTADWFEREYYAHSPAADPAGPETGLYKVIRGGAWSDPAKRVTVFFRNWVRPTQRQPNIGFRCAGAADAAPAAGDPIRQKISAFAGKVTLYARNLTTGASYGIEENERVRTASTIKLPILVGVAQAVAEGKATWDERLPLTKEDTVSGSGVLREFTPGLRIPLRDVANLMIVVSDNTATNLILERITADWVNEVMERYGFRNTYSNRKVRGDGQNLKANPGGWSRFGLRPENQKYGLGVTTPFEMVRLLEMLEKGEIVSPAASKQILGILRRQQDTDGIGRRETHPVASKSGSLDALRSDAGIVYGKKARIAIAITVDGMPKVDYSADNPGNLLIADLTALLVERLGPLD